MMDLLGLYRSDLMTADLSLTGGDLASDFGLESSVINSLFTDARARPDDELPAGAGDDRRGWWGNALVPTMGGEVLDGFELGSRLWLLDREKHTEETRRKAEMYASEALAWIIERGIAQAITVEAEWAQTGVLALTVTITRPERPEVFRYDNLWRAMEGRS
ncbi:MAG: phage GP46 family protein [Magnetovibrionaceae bacterium]